MFIMRSYIHTHRHTGIVVFGKEYFFGGMGIEFLSSSKTAGLKSVIFICIINIVNISIHCMRYLYIYYIIVLSKSH